MRFFQFSVMPSGISTSFGKVDERDAVTASDLLLEHRRQSLFPEAKVDLSRPCLWILDIQFCTVLLILWQQSRILFLELGNAAMWHPSFCPLAAGTSQFINAEGVTFDFQVLTLPQRVCSHFEECCKETLLQILCTLALITFKLLRNRKHLQPLQPRSASLTPLASSWVLCPTLQPVPTVLRTASLCKFKASKNIEAICGKNVCLIC